MIEIGMPKCSHFDARTKFWSSLNTCISHMKHSIAFIFSMVAPYLLDMNFTNLENTAFKKKLFYFKVCTSGKIAKNTPSCGGKMAPSDTVFNKNFFERGERFSQSTYTPKFNFVPKL